MKGKCGDSPRCAERQAQICWWVNCWWVRKGNDGLRPTHRFAMLGPGKGGGTRGEGLFGGVGFDVLAEGEVDVEGFVDAVVEHAQPLGAGVLHLDGAEKVAGLDDDLERVGELVRELADLQGNVFGDLGHGLGYGLGAVSHTSRALCRRRETLLAKAAFLSWIFRARTVSV